MIVKLVYIWFARSSYDLRRLEVKVGRMHKDYTEKEGDKKLNVGNLEMSKGTCPITTKAVGWEVSRAVYFTEY